LADLNTWKNGLPESMKTEVLVRAVIEDPELQRTRSEITKTRTVQQLSQINSMSEFPIPTNIENLMNAEKRAAKKTTAM
jgi:hypothetical protein